jgi:hypothetical protein
MTFDPQSIWTAAGAAGAALVVGYLFGFLQSIAPFLPSTGTVKNWVLAVISAGVVALAAVTSGASPDPVNVFAAGLVFVGIYQAASKTHEQGVASALKMVSGLASEIKP